MLVVVCNAAIRGFARGGVSGAKSIGTKNNVSAHTEEEENLLARNKVIVCV
jgi:hypothetical protein